ncbi:conserved Plasmodium membrane protein, unknown function [Plasmodium sp. gorilla clade G1]|nr:conserved Plasmodium membrane protein, unknown function [Plasmodium sp. gorilla clade G1]
MVNQDDKFKKPKNEIWENDEIYKKKNKCVNSTNDNSFMNMNGKNNFPLEDEYKDIFQINNFSKNTDHNKNNVHLINNHNMKHNNNFITNEESEKNSLLSNKDLIIFNLQDIKNDGNTKRFDHTNNTFQTKSNTTTNNNNHRNSLDVILSNSNMNPIETNQLNNVLKNDNTLNMYENNSYYEKNIQGKMNIINLSDNDINQDDDKRNSFDIFPFFKKFKGIRTKLLSYYDIDTDVVIYRCMCALFPYLNVDKNYDVINNIYDIEKNCVDTNENGFDNNTSTKEYTSQEKNMNTNNSKTNVRNNDKMNKEKTNLFDVETYDEENVRKSSNVNDALDYYDNKLGLEKNPDIYSFVWLNLFISFLVFFLFNIKNVFFNDINNNISTNHISNNKNNHILNNQSKLNILYNTIFFIYSFNIFIPIIIYLTIYFKTKKIPPFKLIYLISLLSYNNIILLPIIFIYKIIIINTSINLVLYLYTILRFLIFIFYINTSIFYIYKYTNNIFFNHFTTDLIYVLYAIFFLSYVSFYILLKYYIFNNL